MEKEKIGIQKLKEIIKLENKKYREINNKYLVFGEHIIKEAIASNQLDYILTTEEEIYSRYSKYTKCYMMDKKDLSKFKSITNTPNVIGVCPKDSKGLKGSKIIGFNKINNPGNLGTILRTAKAFGINDIIIDNESVDLYNPKTVQAMQGVQFHMNIIQEDLYQWCKNTDKTIITTFLDVPSEQNKILNSIKDDYIIIFGNEAQGIEDKFKELMDYNFKLQIKYESLNVAIASGIIIYEMNKGE